MADEKRYPFMLKVAAWATHAFTASGMVAGFFAIVAISEHRFIHAWYFLIGALIIDGVDGTFARLFKVKKVLPNMDGSMMDAVVDFANYALIPAYFIYECGWDGPGGFEYMLPEEWRWLALSALLITSVMYYGKQGMISSDMYFVGFPVMWNLVGFYFYFVLDWGPWLCFGMILFLSLAHFLPLKFIYPSRSTKFQIPNIIATVAIILSNLGILAALQLGWDPYWWRIVSIASLIYFSGLSLYHSFLDPETR